MPLTGEPLSYPDPETSSSTLAHRLNEIAGEPGRDFHSLAAVPAFIPARFSRRARQTIRDFIAEIAGYRVIFAATDSEGRLREPLADRLDSIVTGGRSDCLDDFPRSRASVRFGEDSRTVTPARYRATGLPPLATNANTSARRTAKARQLSAPARIAGVVQAA